jgi:hypothetical protein
MSVQRIFDRRLLVRRRDRVAAGAAQHDFLLGRVADDLTERLTAVNRRFPIVANVGAYHGLLGRRIRKIPGVEIVTDVEGAGGCWRNATARACKPTRKPCQSRISRSTWSSPVWRCNS